MSLLLLDDHAFRTSTIPGTADFAVELGLGVAPWADVEVWTDITRYVRDINTISAGRKRNLDRPTAGKFTFVVDNSDRRFDPTYAAGPYYGNLRPNTPVRFRLQRGAAHAFMFEGVIDGWPQSFRPPAASMLTLSATDPQKLLAGTDLGDCLLDTLQRRDGATNRWKLNDSGTTAVDDLGGMDLTIQNSPTTGAASIVAGSSETAITFPEGTGGREVLEGRFPGGALNPPCTFEIVLQITGVDSSHESNILTIYPIDGAASWLKLRLSNALESLNPVVIGSISIDVRWLGNVASPLTVMGTTPVDDGQTHHIAVTIDASNNIELKIDGVDETRYVRSLPVPAPALDGRDAILALGNQPLRNSGDFGFDSGTLQYATYYPSVLSDAQVAEHADAARTGGEGDTSGERADRVLDAIGFPASKRAIDTGSTVVTVDGYGGKASEYLALLAQTERGQLYVDGEGKLTFRGRSNILTDSRSATSQATFSDDGVGLEYTDIEPTYDELQIRNPVSITRVGGNAVIVQDQAKIDEYGAPNDYAESGLLYLNDFESLSVAQWILTNDKSPRRRIEKLVVEPQSNVPATADALWAQVMARKIGDRITVEDKPLNIGTRNSVGILIEGYEHSMVAGKWRSVYYGSPAETQPFWLLGVAGFSELGSTTYLGF